MESRCSLPTGHRRKATLSWDLTVCTAQCGRPCGIMPMQQSLVPSLFKRKKVFQCQIAVYSLLLTRDLAIMTTWTCLFGFGPGEPHLRNELSVSSFDGRRCALVATQPKQSFFFVFWKPEKPWSRYTRPRYTAQDAEKAAASVADLPINETMVFADLWSKRHRAQLADIEEGVLSRWHYGRSVLVGDAAHKVCTVPSQSCCHRD